MSFQIRNKTFEPVELDVTSFMNLMIVLVPVLLLTMTFTQVTVLDIKLPELAGGYSSSGESQPQLEVEITDAGFKVFYPQNTMLSEIPVIETEEGVSYDYGKLSLVLQEVKSQITDVQDILILSAPNTDYQSLVLTMDTVKSYKTTVVASLVEIELFPNISLGDASVKK